MCSASRRLIPCGLDTINGCFIVDVLRFIGTCNGFICPRIRYDNRLRNKWSHAAFDSLRSLFFELVPIVSTMTKLATHPSLKTSRNLDTDMIRLRGLSLASFYPSCAVLRRDIYIFALVFRNVHTVAMLGCTSAFSSGNGHKKAVLLRVGPHPLGLVEPSQSQLDQEERCQSYLFLYLPGVRLGTGCCVVKLATPGVEH